MDDIAKVLGIVLFLAIVCFAICGISNWAINLVEVNVIKKVNPSYKTKIELEKEEKAKKAELAKQEEEIRQREIELEDIERLKEREMSNRIDTDKIERILKKKGYEFNIGYSNGCCVLDDCVWVCGFLLVRDLDGEHRYTAIAISKDRGNDFKLLKVFTEFSSWPSHTCIFFLQKSTGYLEISGAECNDYPFRIGIHRIYKTTDGGHNWIMVLDTINIRLFNNYVKRMRVVSQKISLITNFQWEAPFEVIESNDGGETWIYKRDYKELARTSDKGATWEIIKRKK